ncbi:mechanosensitive ion channel family protein [Haloarchaeobius sp. HRN-SO-5]|uniref:mechanosensitive ion channel family protein n=1 Tax=Haloarchaeobius sp. HRN-SO-5 TaxID=3446118 RepID=UPI003EBE2E94
MTLEPNVVLQAGIQEGFEEMVGGLIAFAPRAIGALIILLVGWLIGRLVGRGVSRLADGVELDQMVLRTPLGRMLGGTEQAVSRAFGRITAWFVYALAILAAADVLAIELLSEWISAAVSYLPALVAGLLIIVLGFVVADFIADAIARTETVTSARYTNVFADGTRILLYFVVVVMGLDTMGVDVGILFTFAEAAAFGVAAGIALAIGIAFGWGGKDYVANNINDWVGRGPAPVSAGGGATDGGEDWETADVDDPPADETDPTTTDETDPTTTDETHSTDRPGDRTSDEDDQ